MAKLVFKNGSYAGKTFTVPAGKTITVGRNRDLELPLPDLKLSRRHAQLEQTPTGWLVRDLGSTNGTYLNGQRLVGEAPLTNFDRVQVGDTEMEFQCETDVSDQDTKPAVEEKADGTVVSNALEPMVDAQVANQPTFLPGQQMLTPSEQPAVPKTLEELLAEMVRPLPPEPGAAPAPAPMETAPPPPKLLFCDRCNGSIPSVDLDLGEAKEIGDELFCKDCIKKGVTVGPEPTKRAKPGKDASQDIDEILKGLGEVEEIVVEEATEAVNNAVDFEDTKRKVISGMAAGSTRRNDPVQPGQRPGRRPPPAPVSRKAVQNMLGDDFDESNEGAQAAPRKAPPKSTASPFDEDEDLIEIGESGPN